MLTVEGRHFVKERELGKGAFGEVYKVKEAGTSVRYALKKIKVENKDAVNMVREEIGTLKTCNHDHIVRLYGFDVTQDLGSTFVLILMEYYEGGNLNSRLERPSDSETNQRWMTELADALCYLHSTKNIVHRDLKPENVLLTGNGSIKLGDFGLAREYYAVLRQSRATPSDQALMSYLTTVYLDTHAGSPPWMAPEVFQGHYTEKADIFSLGTIFYAIATRSYKVFESGKYFGAFVTVDGERDGLGMKMREDPNIMVPMDDLPRSQKELLRGMLDYNPRNRPSSREVLQKLQ